MYIKEYTDRLLAPIRYALKDNTLEFEMRIKESLNFSLDLLIDEKFSNIKLIDVRQKNQVIINE